jgi:hypothetical protein
MRKRFKVVERGAAFILQLTLLQAPAASGSERSSTISLDKSKPSETSSLDHATNLKQDAKTFAMEWKSSLPVDERDHGIGIIGGTEARSLVGMDGKLYAGIGYWSDSQQNDPRLPGGQVLVLDSPNSQWKVDLDLDERVKSGPESGKRRYFAIAMLYGATFKFDDHGRALAQPVHMLLAGAWDRLGQLQVFSKTTGGSWMTSDLLSVSQSRHAEIRSFFVYRDKITNIEHVFAGARINNDSSATRIYRGAFDQTEGKVRWNENPEAWADDTPDLSRTTRASGRITGFTECNGKLYASVYNMIFERQDGQHPIWKLVFTYVPKEPFEEGSSGFRGISAVPADSGKQQILLVSLEHRPCTIFRIDTGTFQSVAEINVSALLQALWDTRVGYVIAGYNDMLQYEDPVTSESLTLIGFEAATPKLAGNVHHFNPSAHYLVRRSPGQYLVREIADHHLDYQPTLESVRTMVNSPFSEDPPGTVYAGGYDANGAPVHNTAWIYRGVRVKADAHDQ